MSVLTIRLNDNILTKVDLHARKLHLTRAEYIRKSIETMNTQLSENEKKCKLINASKLTRQESMSINFEFAAIEYDPQA